MTTEKPAAARQDVFDQLQDKAWGEMFDLKET
jgi:hypothetical protein